MFMRRVAGTGLLCMMMRLAHCMISYFLFVTGASKFALSRPKSTFVAKFDDSITRLPMREAVRYTEKNMKWTASDFNVRFKRFTSSTASEPLNSTNLLHFRHMLRTTPTHCWSSSSALRILLLFGCLRDLKRYTSYPSNTHNHTFI